MSNETSTPKDQELLSAFLDSGDRAIKEFYNKAQPEIVAAVNTIINTLSPEQITAYKAGDIEPIHVANTNRIVDMLDPDLAAAYNAGNPAIIAAVNNGMTTTAMVVNEVIRAGGSLNALPPQVLLLVNDRMKEIKETQEVEDTRLRRVAAALVGMGAAAMSGETAYAATNGERNWVTNPPSSAEFSQMSDAQKLQYLDDLYYMSKSTWEKDLTKEDRNQHLVNVEQDARERLKEAVQQIVKMNDEMELRVGKTDMLLIQNVLEGDPTTKEGAAASRKKLEELIRERPDLAKDATAWLQNITDIYKFTKAGSAAYDGQQANNADNTGLSLDKLHEALELEKSSLQMEVIADQVAKGKVTNKVALEATKAAAERADNSLSTVTSDIERQAIEKNISSRADVATAMPKALREKIIAQEGAAGASSIEDIEETGARQATVTASALGLHGSAGLAQIGTAPAEAALMAEAPVVAQRKPQGPNQGSGLSA